MKPFTISVPDARLTAIQQKVAQFDWTGCPTRVAGDRASARPTCVVWWRTG